MDTFDYMDIVGCHGTSGQDKFIDCLKQVSRSRGMQAHKDSRTQAHMQSQTHSVN